MRELGVVLLLAACAPEDVERSTPVVRADTPSERAGLDLFDTTRIHDLEIVLDADDADSLWRAPRTFTDAEVRIDGVTYTQAGVRLKGNGSFVPFGTGKSAFTVDLGSFVRGQRHDGIQRFALNNMISDPAQAKELLAYAAYEAMGMPAPRATYVWVSVVRPNKPGTDRHGLYLLVEHPEPQMLEHHFGDGDGSLFELQDRDLVPDQINLLDHDGGPYELDTLRALAEVLQDPEATLSDDAADLVDVEALGRFVGVSGALAQFDAYPYTIPGDDVFLYLDPEDGGRVHLLPHGADEAFADRQRPVTYLFGRLGTACIDDAWCEAAFREAAWDTAEVIGTSDFRDRVVPVVQRTQELLTPAGGVLPREIADARSELDAFLSGRTSDLEAMIDLL